MNSDKVIFNIICRTGIFIRVVAVVVGVYGGSVIGNSLARARLEDGQVSRLFLLTASISLSEESLSLIQYLLSLL